MNVVDLTPIQEEEDMAARAMASPRSVCVLFDRMERLPSFEPRGLPKKFAGLLVLLDNSPLKR